MLTQIPTHVLAGPLGAGKTSLLQHLLSQRPASERWAVLINEFGQIGLDAALLTTDTQGVQMAEIAGGCLCCVNGVPFHIGLGRLLRRSQPDRVFIEASGLGHPGTLLQQLQTPPWHGVLAIQPLIMVLDAPALLAGAALPPAQLQSLPQTGVLLMNKSAALSASQRAALSAQLPPVALHWCEHAVLDLQQLPITPSPLRSTALPVHDTASQPGLLWRSVDDWLCQTGEQAGICSAGWRMHPAQRFSLSRLTAWLEHTEWQRAKAIVHTDQGWLSCNALAGQPITWQESPWRRDNRLELVGNQTPEKLLEQGLRAAALAD